MHGTAAERRIGGAEALHRAARTAWSAGRAPGGAEVHEGLVVVVGLVRRDEGLGERPDDLVAAQAAETARAEEDAAEHAANVGVDERGVLPIGEGEDGARGVAPDAAHGPERAGVVGQAPVIAGERLARDALQIQGPHVVAERVPGALDLGGLRLGQALERRVPREELVVLRDDPVHLGLLQHDLGDQDVIGIGGAAPRQLALMAPIPAEQAQLKAPARCRGRDEGRGPRAALYNAPCPTNSSSTTCIASAARALARSTAGRSRCTTETPPRSTARCARASASSTAPCWAR